MAKARGIATYIFTTFLLIAMLRYFTKEKISLGKLLLDLPLLIGLLDVLMIIWEL